MPRSCIKHFGEPRPPDVIVYLSTKSEFLEDVVSEKIGDRILAEFQRTHHRSVGQAEVASWRNSMGYMHRILSDTEIPTDSGVAIEFGILPTGKRVDFILTGRGADQRQTAIIIELKQWTELEATDMDGVVRTFVGGAKRDVAHPSYQAWSYAALLEDFNETVRDRNMSVQPCAYLHNCASEKVVRSPFYKEYLEKAPAFLLSDGEKLRSFVKKHIRHGDRGEVIYQIRDGKISPSKSLVDCLASLLQGNREFLMVDGQKIVYETALRLARFANGTNKQVLIVDGGPGTGKTVVAINLLVEFTKASLLSKYITKNAAPRAVYESKLTGRLTKSRISNLFTGSGSYTDSEANSFDALIVDEAHRLNEKSGMFQNLGENQIKEIINASKLSIFLIDERQKVTFKDVGTKEEIRKWATHHGASVTEEVLESQFRCNGSDGFLAWVDNTLQVRETANPTLAGIDYQVIVCDSPVELRDQVVAKNHERNKARMVAGYCWDWISKKKPAANDIEFPEFGFGAQWNLDSDGSVWIIKPESVKQIGCIHTCQGLELDYIGVILGPDILVRNGIVQTHAAGRSSMDASIRGYKSLFKKDPAAATRKADEIIKNTYRTLMTRAQKGCFLYSVDPETNAHLKAAAVGASDPRPQPAEMPFATMPLRILEGAEVVPFVNAVPAFDLKVAAGQFSDFQGNDAWSFVDTWVELPEHIRLVKGMFVTRVVGESMNRQIPTGSWCLFRENPAGSRQGKTVLVQHRDIQDPENGGHFTVKVYQSEKTESADGWEHSRIVLKPNSRSPGFSNIVLTADQGSELKVIGEFVTTLGQK